MRFHRQSILSSVRLSGEMVPFVFSGALNGDIFKEYIVQCLIPTLSKGDIVVMDNLSSHKVTGAGYKGRTADSVADDMERIIAEAEYDARKI